MERMPQTIGDGEVVVNTGDRLHPLAIAMRQSLTIERFDLRSVGTAILSDANGLVAGNFRRHGGVPQVLACFRLARSKGLQFFQELKAFLN